MPEAATGERKPSRRLHPPRQRLDLLLVARGLADSRARAQAAVLAGEVFVDARRVEKPGALVASDAVIALVPRRRRYVSRGGMKLEHALHAFGLDVSGLVALDVGASTGGFTDCLLQQGAAKVYAVDVGAGQLHWRLRRDPRVVVRERTHAARLDETAVPEPVDAATVDVSFISLIRVLPAVADRVRAGGLLLTLVKPQFEAGRRLVRRGVVRSAAVHRDVLRRFVDWVTARGWSVRGVTLSPLPGPKGNREFFVWVVKEGGLTAEGVGGLIEAAVAAAHAAPERKP